SPDGGPAGPPGSPASCAHQRGYGVSRCVGVVVRAVSESRDVLRAVLGDDENVVLTVPSRAGWRLRNRDHGFHGDNHSGPQHGVDVFTKLQPRLTTVVV